MSNGLYPDQDVHNRQALVTQCRFRGWRNWKGLEELDL